jgi:small subunit ribosomal protein S6
MSKQYETVFIMTPVLSEEQMKEAVSKYKKMILDKGAEIVFENNWGLRKLAYPIQKKSTGFYYLIEFKTGDDFTSNLVAELELAYKRDERILRYMSVALDKHAIAYNLKKRTNANAEKVAAN